MRIPVLVILLTMMIDAMGIGLILPVMPDLIRDVTGGDIASAAVWGGVLATVFAVMQFFFGPVMGNLSDAYGRKPVLLLSLAALAIDYLIMAVAGTIWLLLVARILGGITSATQAVGYAYMADISKPGEKAQNFGLIGAAFGLGFVLGPLIGGVLGEMGTRAPFYAAAALAAVNALIGWLVLDETVTIRIRRRFDWRRANPMGALRVLGALPGVGRLLVIFFLYQVALYVYPAVWAYFGTERFGWSAGTIGLSLALYGVSMAVVQGWLIRLVLGWLGERGTVIYGLVFDVVAFAAIAIVTSGTLALILTPIAALGAIVTPALQGIMSQTVGDDQQGELQGALTSTGALAIIVSPMLMTGVFAAFTHPGASPYFPGAPFLVAIALTLLALAVFATLPRDDR